jgi:ERO1-like protein alpha
MSALERALARETVEDLRSQFVGRFRNISAIMDCVTCERCRLWGKLQILGLGTALKILLMDGDESGVGHLQRNEVVARAESHQRFRRGTPSNS